MRFRASVYTMNGVTMPSKICCAACMGKKLLARPGITRMRMSSPRYSTASRRWIFLTPRPPCVIITRKSRTTATRLMVMSGIPDPR